MADRKWQRRTFQRSRLGFLHWTLASRNQTDTTQDTGNDEPCASISAWPEGSFTKHLAARVKGKLGGEVGVVLKKGTPSSRAPPSQGKRVSRLVFLIRMRKTPKWTNELSFSAPLRTQQCLGNIYLQGAFFFRYNTGAQGQSATCQNHQ